MILFLILFYFASTYAYIVKILDLDLHSPEVAKVVEGLGSEEGSNCYQNYKDRFSVFNVWYIFKLMLYLLALERFTLTGTSCDRLFEAKREG